jgi:hypothetical protein
MEKTIKEYATKKLLKTLTSNSALKCLISSSANISTNTPIELELGKFEAVQCPIFQFEGKKLFEVLVVAYNNNNNITLFN